MEKCDDEWFHRGCSGFYWSCRFRRNSGHSGGNEGILPRQPAPVGRGAHHRDDLVSNNFCTLMFLTIWKQSVSSSKKNSLLKGPDLHPFLLGSDEQRSFLDASFNRRSKPGDQWCIISKVRLRFELNKGVSSLQKQEVWISWWLGLDQFDPRQGMDQGDGSGSEHWSWLKLSRLEVLVIFDDLEFLTGWSTDPEDQGQHQRAAPGSDGTD